MFKPERGDKIYNRRIVHKAGAGEVFLRGPVVKPGYVLKINHMCAYGNNSAAGESVDLGYTFANIENYIFGKLNTGAVDYRVTLGDTLWLVEGQQPTAHFEAANANEILTLIVNGILIKV